MVEEDLELEQLDVKTAFLHDELDEKIYMDIPEGYEDQFKKGQVCLLNKALYGLKQAPSRWNQKFDGFMAELNFARRYRDSCVYVKTCEDASKVNLLIYVNNKLVAAKDEIDLRAKGAIHKSTC